MAFVPPLLPGDDRHAMLGAVDRLLDCLTARLTDEQDRGPVLASERHFRPMVGAGKLGPPLIVGHADRRPIRCMSTASRN